MTIDGGATLEPLGPGDRVTDAAGGTGLLIAVDYDRPEFDGPAGHVEWESGQDTWALLESLQAAPEASG